MDFCAVAHIVHSHNQLREAKYSTLSTPTSYQLVLGFYVEVDQPVVGF
jgi:hypothetical protein